MHQSISEDERPISSAAPRFTMDANYLNESQRRFTHVYKFFSSDTPAHDRYILWGDSEWKVSNITLVIEVF